MAAGPKPKNIKLVLINPHYLNRNYAPNNQYSTLFKTFVVKLLDKMFEFGFQLVR